MQNQKLPISIRLALAAGDQLQSAKNCMVFARSAKMAGGAESCARWVRAVRSHRRLYRLHLADARLEHESELRSAEIAARHALAVDLRREIPRGTDPIFDNFRAAVVQLSRLSMFKRQAE